MHDVTPLVPLLEAAKACLVSTPWERGAESQQRHTNKVRALVEPTATAVLCQLLDVRRLHKLLSTAVDRHQQRREEEEGATSSPAHPSSARSFRARGKQNSGKEREQRTGGPARRDGGNSTETACLPAEAQALHCTLQHYLAVLSNGNSNVQTLCAVHGIQRKTDCCAHDIDSLVTALSYMDVVDVLFALILCISAALCWQQKRHQQSPLSQGVAADSNGSGKSTGIVSSSRDTSELTQRTSADATRRSSEQHSTRALSTPRIVPPDSVYAAIRKYYCVDDDLGELKTSSRTTAASEDEGLRGTLRRLLPLFEARLPMTELWREPSLLAALDVAARGMWQAQNCVHAAVPSSRSPAQRCPLCYAAALNNELAVEAMVQLNQYYMIYHGEQDEQSPPGGGGQPLEEHIQQPSHSKVEMQARWLVAACRIAIWNGNRAALLRLTAASPPPWISEATSSLSLRLSSSFWWAKEAACVLWLLWTRWWQAEMQLALSKEEEKRGVPSSSVEALVGRDASQRLRSAQLFLEVVFASSVGSAKRAFSFGVDNSEGGQRTKAEHDKRGTSTATPAAPDKRQAVLLWLLSLPLPIVSHRRSTHNRTASPHPAPLAESEVTGTVLHWMCATNEVVLLRLFLLYCSMHDPPLVLASVESPQQPTASAGPPHARKHDLTTAAAKDDHALAEKHCGLLASASPLQDTPHVVQLREMANHSDTCIGAASASPLTVEPAAMDARLAHCCPRLRRLLRLGDTLSRTALDVACQHGHLQCVRILLECGLSPNSLSLTAWRTYAPTVSLRLLRLLYDPSVLDGAAGSTHPTRSSSGRESNTPRVSLADQLRLTCCPAAAARTLAQLAHRLWTEKVQQLSCPTMSTEHAERGALAVESFEAWYNAYLQCQAAQDRVLRPALAALAYDAHEPLARLVVLAVLVRKLEMWLTNVPPFIRRGVSSATKWSGTESGLQSRNCIVVSSALLRELRLQHTVALRLYTQLTCPLGRSILHAAVGMRSALSEAVELREERAAALLLASAHATSPKTPPQDAGVTGRDVTQERRLESAATAQKCSGVALEASATSPPQCSQLPPSEAARARRELQAFYTNVLASMQRLDAQLAAEQRGVTADMSEAQRNNEGDLVLERGESVSTGAAAVLQGRPFNIRARRDIIDTSESDDQGAADTPAYLFVVIPSALALQRARWNANRHRIPSSNGSSPSYEVVEPTLWCSPCTPRAVWVQLPRHLHLDRLLREHDGGGYGVVSQDMPLVAAVQRGDVIAFRHVKPTNGSAPPQFVAQAIFSEPRTLPYLVLAPARHGAPPYVPPPASLVLPFAPPSQSGGDASLPSPSCLGKAHQQHQQLRRATSITLHACCLPSLYVEGRTAERQQQEVRQQHPLDWLQVRPKTATTDNRKSDAESGAQADSDILAVLRTNEIFLLRWSRIVWADTQPCWLASTADASSGSSTKGGRQGGQLSSIAEGTAIPSGGNRSTVSLLNLFSADEDEEDNADEVARSFQRSVAGEKRVLAVRPASAHGHAAASAADSNQIAAMWRSRADASAGAAEVDVVVDVSL
ncbi:hypothetical protein ABL78_5275 [Leptomonas seymouri]|uniref:Uncharacterized protein n=1 Tax=Leptomonas seymouri TaxID=5684 RepID=A0A0N1PBH9_LEPSE|nr:hypothetical protein ABL78_5275 [Leptomonas seymouri]|eukprot:KPI85654.1 hypothetical protein ABL78_5275 [Leptomonas seymouri]